MTASDTRRNLFFGLYAMQRLAVYIRYQGARAWDAENALCIMSGLRRVAEYAANDPTVFQEDAEREAFEATTSLPFDKVLLSGPWPEPKIYLESEAFMTILLSGMKCFECLIKNGFPPSEMSPEEIVDSLGDFWQTHP